MPALVLYNDIVNKKLLQSLTGGNPFTLPAIYENDNLDILYFPVQPTGIPASPYEYVDLTTGTLRIGIGIAGSAPIALQTNFTPVSGQVTVTTTQVGTADLPAIQEISFNQAPYGGSWVMGFDGVNTAPMAYSITAEDLQTTLLALTGAPAFALYQVDALTFQIIFSENGAQPLFTVDFSRLDFALGFSGTFSLQGAGVGTLLNGGSSVPVKFEIKAYPTPELPFVTYQGSTTLYADLLADGDTIPPSLLANYLSLTQGDGRYIRADSGLVGSTALTAGLTSFIVAGLALPFTPWRVLPWISQNGGAPPEVLGVNADDTSYSSAGFKVNFTGETTANHVLNWIVLPAPDTFTTDLTGPAEIIDVTTEALTLDLSAPDLVVLDLTNAGGTVALTLESPVAGRSYLFEVRQGATPHGMTFPANTKQKGGGGDTYTPSGASTSDLIHLLFDGTNYFMNVESNYA